MCKKDVNQIKKRSKPRCGVFCFGWEGANMSAKAAGLYKKLLRFYLCRQTNGTVRWKGKAKANMEQLRFPVALSRRMSDNMGETNERLLRVKMQAAALKINIWV